MIKNFLIYFFLKNKFVLYSSKYMIVTVPRKLVNIFKETKAPRLLFGGNTENSKTKNPAITTAALKMIARPE